MKFIRKAGGFLCFAGCIAALAGILATAVPLIDNDLLQSIIRSFSDPVSNGFIKMIHTVLLFCLAQNYPVFAGGVVLLLIGGVMRTFADKMLFADQEIAPETGGKQPPATDDRTTANPTQQAPLPSQEIELPAADPVTAEDFRPRIIVNPIQKAQSAEKRVLPEAEEKQKEPPARESHVNEEKSAELRIQTEENPIPATENTPDMAPEAPTVPKQEHPEWTYYASAEQTKPEDTEQQPEHAERQPADVTVWETKESTDERVIVAKRENSFSEAEMPSEVTEIPEPPPLCQISKPAEPTPLEQSANQHRERWTQEEKPATLHAEKPFHYKAFRADGRPVITTTMPNVQFQFEQTANLVPAHSEIKYAENEEWKPLPHQNNRVRIISTLGQRSQ